MPWNDTFSTPYQTPKTGNVSTNDTFVPSSSFTVNSGPSNGSLNGTFNTSTGLLSGTPFVLMVNVDLPEAALRERVARRAAEGVDASEATVAVLEQQLAAAEPVTHDERLTVVTVGGDEGAPVAAIKKLLGA